MKKLAIIISHPIQYYTPLFSLLSAEPGIDLKVFYTWEGGAGLKYDPGFKKEVEWDIPLLSGYEYEFLPNTAKDPGTHHFMGIVNPDAFRRIEKFGPDAVLLYGWSFYSHLRILLHFSGKLPVWFRGDSTLIGQRSFLKSVLRSFFLKWIYRHVDKAFYAGSANKEYFSEYGLRAQQLCFLPHAVDNDRFGADRRAEASELRQRFRIAEEDIIILFAGKFEAVKNPLALVQAFKQLNNPRLHLMLAGSGVLEHELANESNGNANIHFTGFINQNDMPVYYQACDLFCLPSISETWGLSVNEAMASSKAVLVSERVGCAADLVRNGENGFVFSSKPGSLKDLLGKLAESKSKLAEMGKKSSEIIGDYSFLKQLNAIKDQYSEL